MSTAATGASPADSALVDIRIDDEIEAVLPLRRRRLGLALIALGVAALAAQSLFEWLLPYDVAVLLEIRDALGWPWLSAALLAWGWAALVFALLGALALPRVPLLALHALAVVAGLVLGSAHATLGGAMPALATLLLVGVASLGWQHRNQAGLTLLAGTALGLAAWDALLTDFPTLWIAALVLVGMFAWIDRQHIRANDRRLLAALEQRDALIRDLDRRSEQLQLVQSARTRLLASISHDLRQPLQAMRLYAEALAGRADCDGEARGLLGRQMQAADDAVAMLDQFSEFSAIEHGMLVSHPELVNGRHVLERVAATLQATHPKSQLVLSVHGREDGTWLWIDRSQLARVVQNLAGNAVRYSVGAQGDAHDAGPARVVLALRPHGDGLALDVVDNGRGIPADKLDLVFEPYVQLPTSAEAVARGAPARAGRGLGLAIVRGLVAQLGLTLAPVRSRVGRGTRFRLLLPAELRRAPPAAAAAGPDATLWRLDGWLLALLDDEDAPRAALRAALEGLGATVIDAASLAELQPRLDAEERFPDALVFDLDLGPGQPDGRIAMATLREAWELVVPAVIVTGRVGSRSVILPPRCTLHEKPVALTDLVASLHHIAPRQPA
jgi:signal transduction histidine kinase/CheY-like chemotaxis protein